MSENKRETGVRIPKEDYRPSQTDQNAGMPKDPHGAGLSQSPDEANEKTRQSDQDGSMANPPDRDAISGKSESERSR